MIDKYPNNLKTRRLMRKMTQRELAEKTGISFRMIQFYEQGVKNLEHAPCDKLYKLAAALETTVSELFLESDFKEQIQIYEATMLKMLIKGMKYTKVRKWW